MKLLDRLVLKEIVPMFVAGISVFLVVYFGAFPTLQAVRLLEEGVPWFIVLKFVGLNLPPALAYTFPMGMLAAALLGFGRLSERSEAVALFAAGIPSRRIIIPVILFSLVVSFFGYLLNDHYAAVANKQIADIKEKFEHSQESFTRPLSFDVRQDGTLQLHVHVEKGYDVRLKALQQVSITEYAKNGEPQLTAYGKTAQWQGGTQFRLQDVIGLGPNGGKLTLGSAKTYDLKQTPDGVAFMQADPQTLDFHDLSHRLAELRASGQGRSADALDAETTLWGKVAIPLASLVFALIGAPLGLRPQRGAKASLGWSLAIIIIFSYYVLYTIMGSLARGGGCPPMLAAFLPDILGIGIGAILIGRASS